MPYADLNSILTSANVKQKKSLFRFDRVYVLLAAYSTTVPGNVLTIHTIYKEHTKRGRLLIGIRLLGEGTEGEREQCVLLTRKELGETDVVGDKSSGDTEPATSLCESVTERMSIDN
jgi:hypothetical protein